MKILSTDQIRNLDAYSIEHLPVSSIDLMERAAMACTLWICDHFPSPSHVFILCGTGNNGGDGLAIGRQLADRGWKVSVAFPAFGTRTPDFSANLDRARQRGDITLKELEENNPLPQINEEALVVDALMGSGLTRSLSGTLAEWVHDLNKRPNVVIAIDIPSGLFADKHTDGVAVAADFTLTFQVPKLAFFVPENQVHVGEWIVLPIGLHEGYLKSLDSKWFLLEEKDVAPVLRLREKFDHKGVFGHALIVAGCYGKAGAAILATRAALRTGAGLVTAHVPGKLNLILQVAVPEAMVDTDAQDYYFSDVSGLEKYTAMGIGCGLDTGQTTITGFKQLMEKLTLPAVFDADALNIIAMHRELLEKIPKRSILTPHIGEFDRLFGASGNHFERLIKLREMALSLGMVIVLKGAHTAIATPAGDVHFNPTGNPGMATAGSGDVLTGVITALLAQEYSAVDAACLGVYLHGLAGDLSAEENGEEALIAGDIIGHLGGAYQYLHACSWEGLDAPETQDTE